VSDFAAYGSLIGAFLFMLLIFAGAYYVTRLMGRRYSSTASLSSDMRVIDRLAIGRDQYLLIVEAGDKTLLMGVSPQRMDMLAELESGLYAGLPPMVENRDFFSNMINRLRKPEGRD